MFSFHKRFILLCLRTLLTLNAHSLLTDVLTATHRNENYSKRT